MRERRRSAAPKFNRIHRNRREQHMILGDIGDAPRDQLSIIARILSIYWVARGS